MPASGPRRCPVCGRGFRGSLATHLGYNLTGGFTRCDWNLNEDRVKAIPVRLRADGWVQAKPTGVLLAKYLHRTHPHLVRRAANGLTSQQLALTAFDARHDYKVWWVRSWLVGVASVQAWSIRKRARLIVEFDLDQAVQEIVEAAFRVGGRDAVHHLEGQAFPLRCAYSSVLYDKVSGEVNSRPERCVLEAGHRAPQHVGERSGALI